VFAFVILSKAKDVEFTDPAARLERAILKQLRGSNRSSPLCSAFARFAEILGFVQNNREKRPHLTF
jgi:hypothetical protein